MGQRISAVAGVKRGPRKRDVDRSTARNNSGGTVGGSGKCAVETKESKRDAVGQSKVIYHFRKTVKRHSSYNLKFLSCHFDLTRGRGTLDFCLARSL